MNKLPLLSFAAVVLFLAATSYASINVTFVNTTVILNGTPRAHVIETLNLQVSNSSIGVYEQDRVALNLTITDWQKVLEDGLPSEFILNPRSSISQITLLPGPLVETGPGLGGTAILTVDYYANNITTSSNIGPRDFEYVFNSSALNFEHTASGEALQAGYRLNLIIPRGAQIVSIYPLPDSPGPTLVNNYKNVTQFSWYAEEPLQKFTFTYTITESLQQEVLDYFENAYSKYGFYILLVIVAIIVIGAVYWYVRAR